MWTEQNVAVTRFLRDNLIEWNQRLVRHWKSIMEVGRLFLRSRSSSMKDIIFDLHIFQSVEYLPTDVSVYLLLDATHEAYDVYKANGEIPHKNTETGHFVLLQTTPEVDYSAWSGQARDPPTEAVDARSDVPIDVPL